MERRTAQHLMSRASHRLCGQRETRVALRRSTNAAGKCDNLNPRRADVSRSELRASARRLFNRGPFEVGCGREEAFASGARARFRDTFSTPSPAAKQQPPVVAADGYPGLPGACLRGTRAAADPAPPSRRLRTAPLANGMGGS